MVPVEEMVTYLNTAVKGMATFLKTFYQLFISDNSRSVVGFP